MTEGFRTTDLTADRLNESAAASRGQRYRFQEQCFLHFWKTDIFKKLAQKNRHPLSLMPKPDAAPGQPKFKVEKSNCGTSESLVYRRCESVLANEHVVSVISENPATVVSQFNSLDGADLFFNLDSSILTQLKPEITLYKIYPSSQADSDVDDEQKTPSAAPLQHKILMPLGEHIITDDEGMPDRAGASSIENLFYDQGVLGNVMLTDLSFKFAGKNVALLNTVENVRFTLSFSSFKLFNHLFETTIQVDPESPEPTEKTFRWAYKDLISYSNKYLQEGQKDANTPIDSPIDGLDCYVDGEKFAQEGVNFDSGNTNDNYFEIQMAIRYNPDDIDWDMVSTAAFGTDDDFATKETYNKKTKKWEAVYNESQERLKSFLRNSAIMLRLQFVAHTIKYNAKSSGADPELLIDFEYKAFIENSLNSPELDIFNLGAEEAKLVTAENNLAKARRLLAAVQREKLTLGEIFGRGGKLDTADEDRKSYNEQYQDLRDELEKGGGKLSWLIWSPKLVAGKGGLTDIIPTEAHLDASESESRAVAKKGLPATAKQYSQIHRELKYDPDNLETALTSTENARAVFEELVFKLRDYLRAYRRYNIGEKYKNIFTHLWNLEKVYWVPVDKVEEQLGFTSASKPLEAEKTLAKRRSNTAMSFRPGPVHVVIPEGVNEDDLATPTAVKDLKGMNNAYQKGNISPKDARTYEKKQGGSIKTAEQRQQDALADPKLSQPTPIGSKANSARVYFTTLGDILDVAITIASSGGAGTFDKGIGYLLGPLLEHNYPGLPNAKKELFNLAWVPISIKALMGFFTKKVIASSRERYLLGDFIKDMIQDLILPSLGSRCVEGALSGNQEIGTITFTTKTKKFDTEKYGTDTKWTNRFIPPFYPASRMAQLPNGCTQPQPNAKYPPGGTTVYQMEPDSPIIWDPTSGEVDVPTTAGGDGTMTTAMSLTDLTSIAPNTPLHQQFNYMLIYVNNYTPIHLDPAKEALNKNNGIYYLHLGKIPSIARGATFTKENITYLREARAMGQITQTGGVALRDVYRFSCSMYGNNIFKPGMLFFVDPTKDGATNYEEWKDLGIGGFYRVVEVDHAVNAGGDPSHITNINAVWETFGSCATGKTGLIDKSSVNVLLSSLPTCQ